jgi:hypothetical protein
MLQMKLFVGGNAVNVHDQASLDRVLHSKGIRRGKKPKSGMCLVFIEKRIDLCLCVFIVITLFGSSMSHLVNTAGDE